MRWSFFGPQAGSLNRHSAAPLGCSIGPWRFDPWPGPLEVRRSQNNQRCPLKGPLVAKIHKTKMDEPCDRYRLSTAFGVNLKADTSILAYLCLNGPESGPIVAIGQQCLAMAQNQYRIIVSLLLQAIRCAKVATIEITGRKRLVTGFWWLFALDPFFQKSS